MFQCFLALSLVVIFCECGLTRGHVISKRSESCSEIKNCSFPLAKYELRDVGVLSELVDEVKYANFCQVFQTFKSCYNDTKSQCNSERFVNTLDGCVAGGDWICTPEGQNATYALSQSECATNATKRLEAQQLMEECNNTCHSKIEFEIIIALTRRRLFSKINFCPYVGELYNCVFTKATDKCGQAFGSFFKRIWQISSKPSFKRYKCE